MSLNFSIGILPDIHGDLWFRFVCVYSSLYIITKFLAFDTPLRVPTNCFFLLSSWNFFCETAKLLRVLDRAAQCHLKCSRWRVSIALYSFSWNRCCDGRGVGIENIIINEFIVEICIVLSWKRTNKIYEQPL